MARMLKEWRSFSIQILRQAAERCVFQQSAHYTGDGSLLWDAATHTAWIMQVNRNANLLAVLLHNIERGLVNFLLEDLKKKVHQVQSRLGPWCAERKPVHRLASLPQTQLLPHHILISCYQQSGQKKKKKFLDPQMRLVGLFNGTSNEMYAQGIFLQCILNSSIKLLNMCRQFF